MARKNWKELEQQFLKEHEKTGISAQDWCAQNNLNYNSARRYIKVRKTAQKSAQNGGGKAEEIAQKPETAGDASETAQNAQFHNSAQFAQNKKRNMDDPLGDRKGERDEKGRFQKGHQVSLGNQGNPSPTPSFEAGNQAARTHGFYSKYLTENALEILAETEGVTLYEELAITRVKHVGVIKAISMTEELIQEAPDVATRIELMDKLIAYNKLSDGIVARIESLQKTISGLRLDDVNVGRLTKDTDRIGNAARKLGLEADKLSNEGKADDTPMSRIAGDIRSIGGNGLMSQVISEES